MAKKETPPDGLVLGAVSTALIEQVRAEITPFFPDAEARARMWNRSALEVGWSIDHESFQKTGQACAIEGEPLKNFPALRSLVASAMGVLNASAELNECRLNVSCLWYSGGHGIPMHCDRPYCYEPDVYGCIVSNTSDQALEFHEFATHGELIQRYVVPEVSGACFLQTGPARFTWKHGVLPLSHGERMSVTWRWFLPSINLTPIAQQSRRQDAEHELTSLDDDSERRIAEDGYAYAKKEFMQWYPEWGSWSWERAVPVPLVIEPPPGLVLARVDEALVDSVLAELGPHLLRDDSGTNVFEVGWSYFKGDYTEHDGDEWQPVTVEGSPIHEFPCLRKLMSKAMQLLHGSDQELLEPRLNVICRLYSVGQSLVMHSDKKDWFEEHVYGCVLQNTSDRVLEFHETQDAPKCYLPKERPGTCFHQSGSARFSWKHGIAPLRYGERISVTWRWFQSHVQFKANSAEAMALD